MTTAKRKTGKTWTGRQRQRHPITHDDLRMTQNHQDGKARKAKKLDDARTLAMLGTLRATVKKRIGQGRAGGPYNMEASPRMVAALRRQSAKRK